MSPLLSVEPPQRKTVLDPCLATRVDQETLDRFSRLADVYGVSRAELLRAMVRSSLKEHEGQVK